MAYLSGIFGQQQNSSIPTHTHTVTNTGVSTGTYTIPVQAAGNWTTVSYPMTGVSHYPYVVPTILLRCAENLFAVNVINGVVKKQDRGTLALDTACAWEIFSNYWEAWALSVKIRKQNGEKDAR